MWNQRILTVIWPVNAQKSRPNMIYAQLLTFNSAHCARTELRHTVTIFRKAGCISCKCIVNPAVLSLASGTDENLASECRGDTAGINCILDVLDL